MSDRSLDPWDAALLSALDGDADGAELMRLSELAGRAGVPAPVLEALARERFLVPRAAEDEPLFDPDDADTVKAGLELIEAGLPLAELLDLARRLDEAMRPVAAEAVDLFARFVRDSVEATSASDEEAAGRLVDAFRTMLPATARLVGHHFRQILIEDARGRLGEGS